MQNAPVWFALPSMRGADLGQTALFRGLPTGWQKAERGRFSSRKKMETVRRLRHEARLPAPARAPARAGAKEPRRDPHHGGARSHAGHKRHQHRDHGLRAGVGVRDGELLCLGGDHGSQLQERLIFSASSPSSVSS